MTYLIVLGQFLAPQALAAINAETSFYIETASSPPDIPHNNDINSLVISIDAISQENGDDNFTIIDVRDAKEFKKVRIPGSINLPLFLVKTKSFLKSKKIVLLDEGYSHNLLLREAKMLRENGFNAVLVLSGGLLGWYRSGRKLAGDFLEAEKLSFIPPDKFFRQRSLEHWTTVIVGRNDLQSAPSFPGAITVPFSQDQSKLLAAITKLKSKKQTPISLVLVITEGGKNYAEIDQVVRKVGLANVFYLKGGLRGYGKFIEQQALLAHPKKMTTGGNTCPTCPQKK